MDVIQIKETCLYVADLARTSAFYAGLLGFPLISRVEGRHVFFRVGTSVLLCFLPEVTKAETALPPHFAYGPQHLAFEVACEQYETTKRALMAKHIEIIHEHEWPGDICSCYFLDPDGHVLEIVQVGMWGR
jgi:catechol 2,3-dioxygenase-like lactoylglutathione lyase family enzyme